MLCTRFSRISLICSSVRVWLFLPGLVYSLHGSHFMDKERLCLCLSTVVSLGRQSTDTLVIGQAIEVIGPSVVTWIDSNEFPWAWSDCTLCFVCIVFSLYNSYNILLSIPFFKEVEREIKGLPSIIKLTNKTDLQVQVNLTPWKHC